MNKTIATHVAQHKSYLKSVLLLHS